MNGSNLLRELVLKEELLLDDPVRTDEDSIRQLLHDDFVELTSSGRTYNHEPGATFSPIAGRVRIETGSVRLLELADDAKLLLYTTIADDDQGGMIRTNRSSVWTQRNGAWRLAFHQGTRRPN